jgi:4-amino-4-deoxy-L-arabinose transferase-like glycosyltransferase
MQRLLFVLVLLLSALHLPWMLTLGPEYDESLYWPATLRMVNSSPERLSPPHGLYLAHRPLPFMSAPYIGALNSYIYTIPVALFGPTTLVFRLTNLVWLGLFFLAAFALAQQVGGKLVAWITLAFLAADVELCLQGITNQGPFLLQLIATCVLLSCFLRYLDTPKWTYIAGIALAIGIGLNEKLTYLWILFLFLSAALPFYGRDLSRKLSLRHLALGLSVLLLLLAPILIATIGNFGVSSGFAASQLAWPADLQGTIAQRLHNLNQLFSGQLTILHRSENFSGLTIQRFAPTLALIGVSAAVALLRRERLPLFLFAISLGLLVMNIFFPEGGRLHHLILMYPLPQVAAALVIGGLIAKNRLAQIAVAGLLSAGLISSVANVFFFNQAVAASGGSGSWSNQITKLAEWEQAHPHLHLVYACWGVDHAIFVLGGGQRPHKEFYFPLMADPLTPEHQKELDQLLRRRDTAWIHSSVDDLQKTASSRLFHYAAAQGLQPRLLQEFRGGAVPRVLFTAISFEPATLGPTTRQRLSWRQTSAAEVEATLPVDFDQAQVDLEFAGLESNDSVWVEFQSADGQIVEQYLRPLEYYALTSSQAHWVFGRNLYPHYFLSISNRFDRKPEKLVIRVESASPKATLKIGNRQTESLRP